MNTPEIVVHEVQSYGMSKVLDLLAESIGQASEAAHSNTHREILTLNEAGRNIVHVRRSVDPALVCTDEV